MKIRSLLFLAVTLLLAVAVVFATVPDKEKKAADKKDTKGCCDMKEAKASKEKCASDMKGCSDDKVAKKSDMKGCCPESDMKEAKATKVSEEKPKPKENDSK